MKKSFLTLVSSTFLLATGIVSAQAADAIVAAPPEAPANGVQICDAFGTGYFYIPGSETCMKIGGRIAVTAGYDSFLDAGYSSVEARMDVDTKSDSELGTIGTKIRLSSQANLDAYTLGGVPNREEGVELAYITVGPAFAGYKESLINKDILYGDSLDLETYLGSLNTTTIGFLADNLGGGFYAGLAVENRDRDNGLETAVYRDGNAPDIAGRFGIAGQSWGGADFSALYSTETDDYLLKATADLKAFEKADFRLTAGYGDTDNAGDYYILAAAGKYAFTDKVSAFTGVSYLHGDAIDDVWTANLGASYALATNFDVKGEAYYTDWKSDDTVGTKLTFVRSW
jgi:hypothetical protein